ncbi:phosphatidylinositol-specific phospholipase C/glycerophosphodiester phosphodiesterase family protein [Stackebrandtia nassauensis]|uniref:Altered inheritance of mitochondria protein 6 n=1 Tax=Stackebrandtia nassauensis (strain DSM 44728 / CIP 108903 / NRRL B-16338 / NBRC 102104 / LLR-40K-21) TaxID=446470 RepID=D3PWH3_STANL|nr:phosphatidylinositol-specific phospholipase C/glycerophosphodiester phosphodiesterase family protein [Stackebrandtia nassauensis]ADD43195.1 hypothetical protein Snas_3533 [Stackebrandtia nassauensis DSM 44728]
MIPRFLRNTSAIAAAAAVLLVTTSGATAAATCDPAGPKPLDQAHAHNDYEHDRPLFDALDHGFGSVEADVWLVDGELLVAHDAGDVDPERTLQSLYLDPLSQIVADNGGAVYPDWDGSLQLLIDIKSDGEDTYRAIDKVLTKYADIMTRFADGDVESNAVTAVISGNRPRDVMEDQKVRYAGYDGRLSDLGTDTPADFMPLVSDNWGKNFSWNGDGEMPADQRDKLRDIVTQAHESGYQVRFWATPDEAGANREAVWRELVEAEVDYLNTDDLAGLRDFLVDDISSLPLYWPLCQTPTHSNCVTVDCFGPTRPAIAPNAARRS